MLIYGMKSFNCLCLFQAGKVIPVWTADQDLVVEMEIQVYQGRQEGKEMPEDQDFQDWMAHQAIQVL